VEIDRDYLIKVYEQSIDRYGGSVVIFNPAHKPMISDHDTFEKIALEAISSATQAENHTVKMNGETYTAAVYNTPDGQWTLTHIVSLSQLTGKLHVIGYWILFIGFAVFALAIVLAFLISGNISQNLKLLTDSMKQFSNGNFDEHIVPASHDEFAIIADNFNTMGQKIKALMREVALEQKQKQQIEYQMLEFQYNALQARLNPHFLYNILDSISSLAKLKDEYDISDWICLLSDMLRESIGQKKRLIPLDEEISYVRKYTTLYQMMYRDHVTFIYKSDPSLSFIPVPAFILQPIVENAIVHGIEGISRHGIIHICSFSQDNTLILEVCDNGHGMSQDMIEMILNSRYSSEDSGSPSHAKVGLITVLERIRLLYGPEFGIRIQSVPEEGTRIRIILPVAVSLYHDHNSEDQE
jgi:sensor histidine kinase YesM